MKVKLFKIFRKKVIKTMFKNIEVPARMMRITYLLNLTKMNKDLSRNRWIRALLRKWRFISFSKKVARKKMEYLYRNLHLNYLEMMNGVFGEEESPNSPSVLKEFERFGTSIGMWENVKPKKEEKKYCKTIKTSYVFDDIGYEQYEQQNYPLKYEEKEFIEEKEYKKYSRDKEDEK